MKKLISVVLCIVLAFSCVSICVSASGDTMKVFVTSDTHWEKYDSVNPDGFYRPHQSLGQVSAISPQIFSAFISDAAASDADYIFISGDLTDSGSTPSAEAFAGILSNFESSTGKSVFVVPGNHDIHMSSDPDDHLRFREIYNAFGWAEAYSIDEATSSYAVELKDDYVLLGINSNKDDGGGLITDALMSWIEDRAAEAKANGKKVIAMMHQQLLEHYTMEQKIDGFYIIDNFKELRKNFAKWGIKLSFTGHMHMGDIASYTDKNGTIYDASTTSLACWPLTYREVSFSGKEINFASHQITSLDVSNLVSGYSDEQKDMIANDPVAYTYGCMEDSLIEEYVKNFINPDYLADALGLEADSAAAQLLKKIIPENILIPLYGEGETVEAKAKELGIVLPRSDYKTVDDLITAFWAALVAGDENLGGSSLEGKLIIDAAYVLILSNAEGESALAKKLLSNSISASIGLKGINNIFTRAALDQILTGLFVDKSPADNELTISGYDNTGIDASSVMQKLFDFFEWLFSFIKNIIKATR